MSIITNYNQLGKNHWINNPVKIFSPLNRSIINSDELNLISENDKYALTIPANKVPL